MHIGKVTVGEIITFIGNPQNKFCRIKKDDCTDLPNDMNYYPSICVGEKITSLNSIEHFLKPNNTI